MQPTQNFSYLPPEIREQIWLYTLSPRTIHLHFHTCEKPVSRRELPSPMRLRGARGIRTKITAVSFSAAQGPINAGSFAHSRLRGQPSLSEDAHARSAVPPGPVALFVCRESRAIAFRHANYERSFAGRNLVSPAKSRKDKTLMRSAEKWLGESKKKRIWVDFECDQVVVDKVGSLRQAKEGMEKIQRLGVFREAYATFCDEMLLFLPLFTGLRELYLYLKIEEDDLVIAEDIEKAIVKDLEQAKKKRKEEWLTELPVVKVVLYNS